MFYSTVFICHYVLDIVMMAQPLEALEYTAVASLTPPCLVSNND
jgi:hypothetical protein